MRDENLTIKHGDVRPPTMWGKQGKIGLLVALTGCSALAALLAGCININAPEEAIVIELNVNIQAEVVYRLAEDAGNAIDENADIF